MDDVENAGMSCLDHNDVVSMDCGSEDSELMEIEPSRLCPPISMSNGVGTKRKRTKDHSSRKPARMIDVSMIEEPIDNVYEMDLDVGEWLMDTTN